MGLYHINCPSCNKPHTWFSGSFDQRCYECKDKHLKEWQEKVKQEDYGKSVPEVAMQNKKATEEDIDKFLKEHSDLMDDLSKQEEIDKIWIKLQDLRHANDILGKLIEELEESLKEKMEAYGKR